MKGNLLSRRYAGALADVAEADGQLLRVRSELNALADAVSVSHSFQTMARTARRSRQEKKAVFGRISEQLNLCRHTARLLEYLAQKKRAALLPMLAESFAEEADRRLGVRKALLTTAMELTEGQRDRLIEKLEKMTQAKIELAETVDESLIAGFQLRLDGRSFDGSLRGQLDRIRERMAHGR